MRRLMLVALAAAGFAFSVTAASAADWTGFYAGANAGYGHGSYDNKTNYSFGYNYDASVGGNKGWVGGLQAGYNYQLAPRWVIGVETDIQLSGLSGSRTVPWCSFCGGSDVYESKLDWFGTLRGRVGFLPWQRVMVYGTGGLAYGGLHGSMRNDCTFCSYSTSYRQTAVGWTAGGGIEYVISDRWSAKAEYLHVDLSGQHASVDYGSGYGNTMDVGYKADIFRVGVNYHF